MQREREKEKKEDTSSAIVAAEAVIRKGEGKKFLLKSPRSLLPEDALHREGIFSPSTPTGLPDIRMYVAGKKKPELIKSSVRTMKYSLTP